jgi:4a-hydroxytetrahydrobiopterin dehydratase
MSNEARTPAQQVLPAEQIESRLAAALPAWRLEGGSLCRTVQTSGWKSTLMVVNAIGHLAEAAWHHPDLTVRYGSVTIGLMSHDAGGITERDFALAAKLESVLMWRPGQEPGAVLEGTPQKPPALYIKYD